MKVDWIIEFTRGLFSLMDAAEFSECDVTKEGIANRTMMHSDREGITVFSPRWGRFAHLRIDIVDNRPELSFEEWDHVVELNLCTLSGGIEISTICGSDVYDPISLEQIRGELDIEPGIYQLYVLFANLAVVETRLGELKGDDYTSLFYGAHTLPDSETFHLYENYRIILWPLKERIVKRFKDDFATEI